MATYFYVSLAEGYVPATKSRAALPSQVSVSPSDCAGQDLPGLSHHWSLNTDNTAFIMRQDSARFRPDSRDMSGFMSAHT